MSEKAIKTDYYVKMKPKMMAQFDKSLQITKDLLMKKFSESKTKEIIKQMKNEYEELFPEIPYIGGKKNPYTTMLVNSVADLAIMRILEKEGLTYHEIGEFIYESSEIVYKSRIRKLKKTGQHPADQLFNKVYVNYVKTLTEKSQKKQYPYDWVWEFVEGDGKIFDYGFNISECGIHKVFKKLGAEKYVPFICLIDYATANMYGFGFTRTQNLGNGAPICDLRYIKNGTTPRGWPPNHLQEYKME
ncbi:MAG: L-2-amino-thiazoline-4-carboxylic acid hydrolase [Promethearchaeota archaeon]